MNRTIGYTTGVFDMFHIGHLNILEQAKKLCDHLVVGVTTDELAFSLKGRAPVIPFEERLRIVRSIAWVNDAVPEANSSKLDAWEKIRFHKIFKGSDWRGTPKWNEMEKQFASRGVEVVYFEYTMHTSSTMLRRFLETRLSQFNDQPELRVAGVGR